MIIHNVKIENFRGISHLSLGGLPDTGVFVISGDNEQGKSTIMEAIACVLTEPHGTKKQAIKAIQPVGQSVAPTVELTATVGDYTFSIEKRWIKGASSRLSITAPQPAQFVDREADNELQLILENNVDRNLLDKLFIAQDQLDPHLAAVGIPSLEKALNAQSGGADDAFASSDDALMRAVEEEYAKYFTAKGQVKKSSDLDRARQEAADAYTAREEALAEVRDLQEYVRMVERARETIAQNARQEPELQQAVVAAGEAATRAEALAEKREATRQQVVRAEESLGYASKEQTRLSELKEEERKRDAARVQAVRAVDEAHEAAQLEEQKIAALTRVVEAAQEEEENAYKALESAKKRLREAQEFVEFRELKKQLERIAQAEKDVASARRLMPEFPVTKKDLSALEKLHSQVEVARAVVEAAQATLDFSGSGEFELDGETYDASNQPSVALHAGSILSVGSFQAVYSPGSARTAPQEDLDKASTDWERSAQALHVASLAEAYERHHQTIEAEDAVDTARRVRDDAVGGLDVAEAKERLAELEEVWANKTETTEDTAAISEQVPALEEAYRSATLALRSAQSTREPWLEKKAAQALTQARARLELAGQEHSRAVEQREAAAEQADEDSLAQRVQAAQAEVARARDELQAVEEACAKTRPEHARERYEAAEAKLRAARKRIQDSRDTVNQYQGRIEQAQGAEERRARAEDRCEAAQRRLDSIERQANAARVLRDTLKSHQDAARQRYAQPFAEALQDIAQPIFGAGVQFGLDEDLQITERTQGERTVPVSDLSGGAKEQLMLLSRFAVAKLADGDSGQPVPVFIDDALGNTDTGRLNDMAMAVNRLGKQRQVFVLTCVPERFDAVVNKHDFPIATLRG